ncbi:hypothetical protein [Ferrimonas gelatinilytica]|uniref:Uncharacterized protein n=1 Tax=Ferrimonas gelatinilytica TaxID=1255257 RepID=A0ABP9RZH3_9GAMM
MAKKISTSALAKRLDLPAKGLFERLERSGYLRRQAQQWQLTEWGQRLGGETSDSEKFGRFVVWPEDLLLAEESGTLPSEQLAAELSLIDAEFCGLLQVCGYLQRWQRDWWVTLAGRRQGGCQGISPQDGRPISRWPKTLLTQAAFQAALSAYRGSDADRRSTQSSVDSFKQRFEAKYRTLDGHYVCTLAQLTLANFLYLQGVAFACFQPLPGELELVAPFYLPLADLYLELPITEPDEAFSARQAWYQANGMNWVALDEMELSGQAAYRRLGQAGVRWPDPG